MNTIIGAFTIGAVFGLALAGAVHWIVEFLTARHMKKAEIDRRVRLDEKPAEPPKLGHLTGSPRTALVVDGPLEGMIHELYGSFRPDVIAFPPPGDGTSPTRHFYRLDPDGGLRYLRTEPRASV